MCTKICIKLSSQIEIIFGIFSKTPSEKRKICLCFSEDAFELSTKLPQINCFNYSPTGTPTAPTGVKLVMGGLELPSQPPNLDAATLVTSLNRSVPARQLQQFVPQTQGLSWAAGALAKHVRR